MRLLLAAGVVRASDVEESAKAPAVVEALAAEALAFIHAGGVLSLADWCDLLPCERAAFLAARRAYDAERAVWGAVASMSPHGAAEVAAPADGGDAKDTMRLDAALEKVVGDARALGADGRAS